MLEGYNARSLAGGMVYDYTTHMIGIFGTFGSGMGSDFVSQDGAGRLDGIN